VPLLSKSVIRASHIFLKKSNSYLHPLISNLNISIIYESGGEEKTTGPEGQQFLNIMKSISPIEK